MSLNDFRNIEEELRSEAAQFVRERAVEVVRGKS